MTGGLQTFDASGRLVLDLTDRITRIMGRFTTPPFTATQTGPGSILEQFVPIAFSGSPWIFVIDPNFNITKDAIDTPPFLEVTQTGIWIRNYRTNPGYPTEMSANLHSADVIYGVY